MSQNKPLFCVTYPVCGIVLVATESALRIFYSCSKYSFQLLSNTVEESAMSRFKKNKYSEFVTV
jgi:hypothetical protein